jgi:hypothetical protein
MTRSTNRLILGILLLAPVALAGLPGAARADTHRFVATMAAAPAQAALISSEMRWACEGPACAAQGPLFDAPARICARLAREQGRVESFAVNGVGFSVEQMERCNARALARRPAPDLSADAR